MKETEMIIMRWSFEELIYGIKGASNSGRPFLYKLTHFPISFYRILKVIFKWIFHGYCWKSIWDLKEFFMIVIYQRLKMFKKMNPESYPCDMEEEEWKQIIDRLIKGFDVMRNWTIYMEATKDIKHSSLIELTEEEKQMVRDGSAKQDAYDEETLQLLARYYRELWN